MALSWQQAALLAAVLLGVAAVLFALDRTAARRAVFDPTVADHAGVERWRRRLARVRPFITEIGTISGLYAIWQLLGTAPVFDAAGAIGRGEKIERIERDLGLPSEHWAQRPLLAHPLLAQAANLFYDTMHFTLMFVLLVWVFVRHRERYRDVRTLLILVTLFTFAVQLIPVAPPRLLPDTGYVDTAARYGQSVYSAFGSLDPNQLSAMPSMHVAWAGLVGLSVVWISRSRWRWLALLYPASTIFVVSATANHYWADGIVALALLALSVVVLLAGQRVLRRLIVRSKLAAVRPVRNEPVPIEL